MGKRLNRTRPAERHRVDRHCAERSSADRNGTDLDVVHQTRWVALAILLSVCATACVAALFIVDIPVTWHVWAAYLLVIPAVGLLLLSMLFVVKGQDRMTRLPFWMGFCFIVGGIAFDVWATLLQSPDLALEGNMVISALLYTDHDPDFIYVYGLGLQSILCCIMILLWAGFLRHRHTWFDDVMNDAPLTYAEFLKATTGGGKLSWRQYIIPGRMSDFLCGYHVLLWTLPPMLVYAAAFRWYAGLDWFEIVPGPYSILGVRMMIGMAAVIFTIFFVWLYREFYTRTANAHETVQ